MKKLFSLLLMFFAISTSTYAQDEVIAEKDVSGENEEKVEKSSASRDRFIVELAHNRWVNAPDDIQQKWYNRGINMYVMYDLPFISNNVALGFGGGIASENVYHNGYISYDAENKTVFQEIPSTFVSGGDTLNISDPRRNKISTTYFEIPIELRFRTNPNKSNKSFKIAVGGRLGLRLDAHTKYRGDDLYFGGNREIFIKEKLITNTNNIRYGVSGRIGYGNFNIFGFYALNPLFQNDRGPEMQQLSIGVSFNAF